jgi:hypothetical protein
VPKNVAGGTTFFGKFWYFLLHSKLYNIVFVIIFLWWTSRLQSYDCSIELLVHIFHKNFSRYYEIEAADIRNEYKILWENLNGRDKLGIKLCDNIKMQF